MIWIYQILHLFHISVRQYFEAHHHHIFGSIVLDNYSNNSFRVTIRILIALIILIYPSCNHMGNHSTDHCLFIFHVYESALIALLIICLSFVQHTSTLIQYSSFMYPLCSTRVYSCITRHLCIHCAAHKYTHTLLII